MKIILEKNQIYRDKYKNGKSKRKKQNKNEYNLCYKSEIKLT